MFWLPDSAVSFIQDFDAGFPVSPFSFILEMPDEVLARYGRNAAQ
jgi:hypothetical protein